MTTMVLSIYNAQIILNSHTVGVVLPLALFYGGIAQFIAGEKHKPLSLSLSLSHSLHIHNTNTYIHTLLVVVRDACSLGIH